MGRVQGTTERILKLAKERANHKKQALTGTGESGQREPGPLQPGTAKANTAKAEN